MKKKIGKTILIILLILASYLYYENAYMLNINTYTIKNKKITASFNGYTILQLSDLHSAKFGDNNERLIKKINKINPDIIVTTGDMMNSEKDDGETFINLVKQLNYPIYFIKGNHEQICEHNTQSIYDNYKNELVKNKVHIIHNDKVNLKKGNDSINLFGYDLPLLYYSKKEELKRQGNTYDIHVFEKSIPLNKFEKDKFNILLVHDPSKFKTYQYVGADLILSGHIHGGIIRIPFVGGLVSPYGDFLPKYSKGKYTENNKDLIVNAGLGNYTVNFRAFNPPEISVIKLK